MDLVAAMLARELPAVRGPVPIEPEVLRPRFLRPLTRLSRLAHSRGAYNAERALNRYAWYPLRLRRVQNNFDVFHIVDHSYAHLVNYLPAARTIVTCHDLDTFRPLLDPAREPRSVLFRAVIRHVLKGLRSAVMITCNTMVTHDAIVKAGIRKPEEIVRVPYGVDTDLIAEPPTEAEARADEVFGRDPSAINILHVGSVDPRKRIDLLLKVFAGISKKLPASRLIRVGGVLPPAMTRRARDLGVYDRIVTIPFLEHRLLSSFYRRADLVLMPSESEGFGLPVIEALACGAPIIATDIPVLREVGGEATHYCSLGDIDNWVFTAIRVLNSRGGELASQRRAQGVSWASQFTWSNYANRTAAVYRWLASPEFRFSPGSKLEVE